MKETKKKNMDILFAADSEYYGFYDEDDPNLLLAEAEAEKKAILSENGWNTNRGIFRIIIFFVSYLIYRWYHYK